LAAALVGETGGNPFFIGELLRHLHDTGERDLDAAGVPDSVREVVLARIGRTGDDALPVLAAAAVIGPQFEPAFLADVTSISVEDVEDVLARAAEVALVRPAGPGFRFAHALVQHALYDNLSAARRARLHSRVADLLENTDGAAAPDRASAVAHHLIAAHDPVAAARAAEYARRAGDHALDSLAPEEAMRWYGIALDLLPGDPTPGRLACLVGLGDAQRQTGFPGFRATLLEAARLAIANNDTDALVDAALANNRGFASRTGGLDNERVAVLEAAVDAVGPDATARRARLLALLAVEICWSDQSARRRGMADEALAIARRLGDPAVLAEVLQRRIMAIWGPSTLGERLLETAELEQLGRDEKDHVATYWASFFRMTVALEAVDFAESERCHRQANALADEIGQPLLRWNMIVSNSWWTLLGGDTAGAEQLAHDALDLGNALGQSDALPIFGTLLYGVRWHQGRLGELEGLLASGVRDTPELTAYRAALGLVLVAAGKHAEAADALASAHAAGFTAPDLVWLVTLTSWAEVAVAVGDRNAAAALYDLLAPWHGQVVFSGANIHGAVDYYLGVLAAMLDRTDAARAHLNEALRMHDAIGAPFYAGRTRAALNALGV
jgi:tetratricopeptide (TPR) repeat protein